MKKILILMLMLLVPTAAFAKNDITVKNEDGIYHITLSGNSIKKKIKFVQSDKLTTNKQIHEQYQSRLTINTGFFDPNNEDTISYIVTDKKITANPMQNPALMNSEELKPHLDKILNRSELRIVKCGLNNYSYQIAPHFEPVAKGCKIITSAQGGPQILPDLRLEEEFFILKEDNQIVRQSASVLFRTARTIVGIKDDELHILIITMDNPKSLRDVYCLCKKLGFDKAMGFDGGSSTSLNYENIDITSTYSSKGRKLKSFMIIE